MMNVIVGTVVLGAADKSDRVTVLEGGGLEDYIIVVVTGILCYLTARRS